MKPSKKTKIKTKINAVYGPPGREPNTRSINSSPPTPLKINEKIEAPISMVKIIVDTIAVFWLVSFMKPKDNFPFIRTIKSAPAAPIADASVGVAIPAIMEPKTKIIYINGKARVLRISLDVAGFAPGSNKIFGFFRF